jgi:hypothetical protein
MKVIIIDDNVDRHHWHNDIWSSFERNAFLSIVPGYSTNNLLKSGYNLALIHTNNSEANDIEELEDCGFQRIFFSGGYTSIQAYPNEKLFYVPLKYLKSFLENNLIEFGEV